MNSPKNLFLIHVATLQSTELFFSSGIFFWFLQFVFVFFECSKPHLLSKSQKVKFHDMLNVNMRCHLMADIISESSNAYFSSMGFDHPCSSGILLFLSFYFVFLSLRSCLWVYQSFCDNTVDDIPHMSYYGYTFCSKRPVHKTRAYQITVKDLTQWLKVM